MRGRSGIREIAATYWFKPAIEEAGIAKYFGHSTIQMTMRYSHLVPKVNQAAADAMDAFYASCVGNETDTRTDAGIPAGFP